jgi:hypothetical protein
VLRSLDEQSEGTIQVLSGVLRLGRKGAATDHSSVLFNVDITSGEIGLGVTNANWYRLGVSAVNCPWLPVPSVEHHPDEPYPIVTGQFIPDFQNTIDLVTKAHMAMMKEVPIVGWDVAFTEEGLCLLEVNLSCNFFRAHFDIPAYLAFVSRRLEYIEDFKILDKSKVD